MAHSMCGLTGEKTALLICVLKNKKPIFQWLWEIGYLKTFIIERLLKDCLAYLDPFISFLLQRGGPLRFWAHSHKEWNALISSLVFRMRYIPLFASCFPPTVYLVRQFVDHNKLYINFLCNFLYRYIIQLLRLQSIFIYNNYKKEPSLRNSFNSGLIVYFYPICCCNYDQQQNDLRYNCFPCRIQPNPLDERDRMYRMGGDDL